MAPNYETAAIKALETLVEQKISTLPIDPLPIIKNTPGVLVMPFADLASNASIERNQLVPMFGQNQDAVTFYIGMEKVKYVVAYNQYLPTDIRRGLARELGHIKLGHDGTRPLDVRMEEAMCFARHLIFPRPVIRAIQESGIPFTVEVVGSGTGCYERCLEGLRKTPGVKTLAELNRAVRNQFSTWLDNFIGLHSVITEGDHTPAADFGHYMDGYEE